MEKQKSKKGKLTQEEIQSLIKEFDLSDWTRIHEIKTYFGNLDKFLSVSCRIWILVNRYYFDGKDEKKAKFKSIVWWLLKNRWQLEKTLTSKDLANTLESKPVVEKAFDYAVSINEKIFINIFKFDEEILLNKFLDSLSIELDEWKDFLKSLSVILRWNYPSVSEYNRAKFKKIIGKLVEWFNLYKDHKQAVEFIRNRILFVVKNSPKQVNLFS